MHGEWKNMSFKFTDMYNVGEDPIFVKTFITNSLPLFKNIWGYIGLAACPSGLSDYSFN